MPLGRNLCFIFLLVFLSGSALAAPPAQTSIVITDGLQIESSYTDTYKQSADHYIHSHVFNVSSGLLVTTPASCKYHVYSHNLGAEHVYKGYLTSYGDGFQDTMAGANFSTPGDYSLLIWCNTSNVGGFSQYTWTVTPTGKMDQSVFDNPFPLFLLFIGLLLLGLGMTQHNPWVGFISSILFILGGMYVMIYGLNNTQNLYSQAIGVISLGIGLIFMFLSAFEFIWGDSDYERDEE